LKLNIDKLLLCLELDLAPSLLPLNPQDPRLLDLTEDPLTIADKKGDKQLGQLLRLLEHILSKLVML
jgi:hypothetical protein